MSGGVNAGGEKNREASARKEWELPRQQWLLRRVSCIIGVRKDRIDAFLNAFGKDDVSVRSLSRFFDDPETAICFFHVASSGESCNCVASELPTQAQMKRKVIVAVRVLPDTEITEENMQSTVVLLELAKGLMDMLNSYSHSIYLSLLSNAANQKGWSDLISKDLMDKFHVFLANLHVTVGLMRGQTLLPLPPRDTSQDVAAMPGAASALAGAGSSTAASSTVSKDRVHVFEGAVITWTKQIRYVLKQEPQSVFKDGANPEPSAELQFWKNRAANLNSINVQLQTDGVKKVLKFLESNKSTYIAPFTRLQKEAEDAREEANDTLKFLNTLAPHLHKLMQEGTEFESLDQQFDCIFHIILLIWKYSKYYNTHTRLAVLLREICNTVINQSMRYIPGANIFSLVSSNEVSVCHEMLEQVFRVCGNLKESFNRYREQIEVQGGASWKMKNGTLFSRLDAFRERVSDLLEFSRTVLQFRRLERVDIGGTKGRTLSYSVNRVFEEFEQTVHDFQLAPYDIMDVGQPRFDADYMQFRSAIKDLDRRLGSILVAGFDDLDTLHGRIKLFDAFEGLLERPIIQAELERKQGALTAQYNQDLQEVHRTFQENKSSVNACVDGAPIFSNLPPVAGAIYWARCLRSRCCDMLPKLDYYNNLVRQVPASFSEVEKFHVELIEMLDRYEKERFSDWEAESVEAARQKLTMKLLRRHDKTGLLKVNFDPALVRLLREVRFLLVCGLEVPAAALEMYEWADTYRQWTSQLDHIVELYNSVLTELLPVEEPLLEDRIQKMDHALSPGLTDLRWRSAQQIPDFIKHAMKVVSDVSGVVDIMKGNLRKISTILSMWCKESLLERKRGAKPMNIEDFDLGHKARVGVRLMSMTDGGKEIHRFLKDSSESLKISKTAPTWKAYVDFVNNIVIEGFVSAIAVSLQYLCEILDPLIIARHEMLPLFDVKIELQDNEIVFDPMFLDEDNPSRQTLRTTIEGWLKDFFAMATVMPRLDSIMGDYLNEIKEHFQMQCLLALVSELIDNTEMKCMEYRQTFMEHSFLWVESVDRKFEHFKTSEAYDLIEQFEEEGMTFRQIMERVGVDIGPPIPSLELFDKEISRFRQMKQDLSALKTPIDIHWLRINVQPVKVTLVAFARKWEEKYTGFVREFVEDRISSITKFIDRVKIGLGPPSAVDNPEDAGKLYETMAHIRDVKLALNAIKRVFAPIRDQVQLLRKHHVLVSDSYLFDLEAAPAQWEEVIRAAFNEKEKILPLQSQETLKIRSKIEGFHQDVELFRAEFLQKAPFGVENAASGEYDESYNIMNDYHDKTLKIRQHADNYNDLELLFDMAMSNYQPITSCLDDLVLLKTLWDMVVLVRETFVDWYEILWDKINTEAILVTVKDLNLQVRSLPKGMRSWPLYSWLLEEVKNMQTALPLVNDLHSDTMRDRHWTMLMTVTKKHFDKGPDFCFKNLLDLELHHFADDVSEIVDQSAKEAKIEKQLANIKGTWSKMTVEFDTAREDCPLLCDLSEVLERLDADSLEMMGMTSQGRFIEFCKETVKEWSEKLRTIDSVLQVWKKFQTNWCRLEPIFMQSDDIRSQLPDDSKRFEQLDNMWKDMMMEVSQASLIVEICCAEGREETLESISESIEVCEKSLNEYLEQKKKAFPRFYFVANQALLDILSNGNRPLKVAEYLGDVFEGIKTLDFSKDPKHGRIAIGHLAKDGEFVTWQDPCHLDGAVEAYLSALEQHVRISLREILEQARTGAESWELYSNERSRDVWLEDYCAQLALLASQIIWTEETNRAFEDIESGSETAMRDYKRINDDRIDRLIRRVQGNLDSDLRTKIITVITIDVHSRDIIESFVTMRLADSTDFKWASQLRFFWQPCPPASTGLDLVSFTSEELKTCVIRICDWVTVYLYEYVGNIGRLVITPLTDRCYITLTQALNLNLGGAPAGPAGTGKTETTKDLSRALGLPIVVFNCSDQMTFVSMAQIFMGLAQVGAWGCFDEFNRISIEVLSVVSTQYKSILDAIRSHARQFIFMEEEIRLVRTVGAFITMNPGYAGRTELPENLKALFRSVAMIVPDLRFICENMLMSEGFIIARALAQKFVTLYSLCRELLSHQMHYDWGLRAVKSLLRQAGTLKRKEPDVDENLVLCRALRDFNLPKITTLDMPIFLRLIQDLFPGIKPEPFQDPKFEKTCMEVVKGRLLQPDPGFISKLVGLLEILLVRHCCFIIGPAGCGKTETWKSLMDALKVNGQDGMWEQVNPKAITSDELYGTMSKSKEWKDGAIAVIMRNMSKEINLYKATHLHKWLVLDGDIDATWIESMNTVMDDNKTLTLVSNERIPFTPTMRMLLEIQDMKHASPATVSRGGVLFINESDIGWKPYVESWRERLDGVAQSTFYLLFANYFEANTEQIRKMYAFVCPILDIGFVQSMTCFLDALLHHNTKENMEALRAASHDDQKLIYEAFFIYALMWTVGGAVADDKIVNHRRAFSSFIKTLSKNCKFPDHGDCFDYSFEATPKEWVHWEKWVTEYNPVAERMFQNVIISTVDLERMKHVLDLHVHTRKPALLVGVAGTGKTTIVKDYLMEIKAKDENMLSASINLNSYTTSAALQAIVMGQLDKRSGRTFGPPGHKQCIYFIDDLNMPYVDAYDTQSAIMLLTQIVSYGQVYDRAHLDEKKDIVDILFTACMNPKAGSFMINGRLQRHFTVLTTYSPSSQTIYGIYSQILDKHLSSFGALLQRLTDPIVHATGEMLTMIQNSPCFLPSAAKFHYQFNLKDVSNIFQGLVNTEASMYREGNCKFLRVWLHEAYRVFSDRLISNKDESELQTIIERVIAKSFVGVPKDELFAQPLAMTYFVSEAQGLDRHYLPVRDMPSLRKVLEDKLKDYNNEYAAMNLVLFDDAIMHVCRICRITDSTCGNALLIGVGGSGKQSLARLASYINNQDVLTILVNQTYGMPELKDNLQEFYKKTAVKPATPHAFLMTDAQIVDERFLVYINDMLSSANIPDLFAREEYDAIFNSIRNVAKYHGYVDDRESLFQYFLDRVRMNLHLVLCHSPVGDSFRVRGRKFPALISCMALDVFHPWPRGALEGVARRFLPQNNIGSDETLLAVSQHMAEVHLSIDSANRRFLEEERRYNFTTPKSFLELVNFYVKMLADKQSYVGFNITRLNKGLGIMTEVQEKVAGLKNELTSTMQKVDMKKAATDALIEKVTVASQATADEKAVASQEEARCAELAEEAQNLMVDADKELDSAMPAMEAAKKAIDCLDKTAIQELKTMPKPPPECESVCAACAFLLRHERRKLDWKGCVKMMNNPTQFLEDIKNFDANAIPDQVLGNTEPFITQPYFNFETMKTKSFAAACLANWVVNIVAYHKMYLKVAPLMERVKVAKDTTSRAEADLSKVRKRVQDVEAASRELDKKLKDATAEKEDVENQAIRCQEKLLLAERLVNGLADENERWSQSVKDLNDLGRRLIGNCLLASAFVGYVSPFSARLRQDLWQGVWTKDLNERGVPMTAGIDPLTVLANDADIAKWQNEGLPADRVSVENASILTSCSRWPLLIDPQQQGVRWIKQRIGEDLIVLQLTMQKWLEKVASAIQYGNQLLIEAVGEEIDAVLEPVLSRAVIRRGKGSSMTLKLSGVEIDYDVKFQLYLQSKLSNPHFRPEISAQCTIINFIVTPLGLEEQILAIVVDVEKPQLEQDKQELVRRQNQYKVELSRLEDELLAQLSSADADTILENLPLIEGLEKTKATSKEITLQVNSAQDTEVEINRSRDMYRPVAAEGSMLFFLVNQLCVIEHMYQYSLDSFTEFLDKAIDRAQTSDDVQERVKNLIAMIRITIFRWVHRGLFEEHKLIFCTMLTFRLFQLRQLSEEFSPAHFQFLLRGPSAPAVENPLSEWLPNQAWAMMMKLTELEGFENFAQNLEKDAPNRFKEWFNDVTPENVKLPLDWKRLDNAYFQKLLVIRCLRPDRMATALGHWIRFALPNGRDYMDCDGSSSFIEVLSSCFEDSTNGMTPLFFILSPGADPVKEVEALGRKIIQLQANVNYHNVAMGQGQDIVAMQKLELGHKDGHWVMLQNIHLMPKWCVELEKRLDVFAAENSHPLFRLFLSADPSTGIPIGILERSIKLTNEPPQGLIANLRRSFALFNKDEFEDRDSKIKSILFGMCHFHSLMLERKKFGPLGYNNTTYPFSNGDLRDSASVLYNYLEGNTSVKIPWEDLRYLIGDIMYGGHIVDDWDRKICEKYLYYFMQDELLDEQEMIPYAEGKLSWKSPSPGTHDKYIEHIDTMPAESPLFFGMHPNAEIGFRTAQCHRVFELLQTLQPKHTSGSKDDEGELRTPMQRAEEMCEVVLDEVRDVKFATDDLSRQLTDEDKGPYQFVFLQECECMNALVHEMGRGLGELQSGFRGELTMSEQMEQLADAMYRETLPRWWVILGFPSTRPLRSWLANLKERCTQLDEWIADPLTVPKVVDVSKLFNPQSFLTAIKQVNCQQGDKVELDKLQVFTEVTKRDVKMIDRAAPDGAYVTGMYLEGARWDTNANSLEESKPKEMFTRMPVINCKAGPAQEKEEKNVYICPTYCVPTRRPYFVFSAQLRTKHPPAKWVLAGVALILDIGCA